MLIARRADTRARADFATWKMMAKLNGASALPAEAQNFLAAYKKLLGEMAEADATEATITLMYKAYYKEMGGAGMPPDVRPRQNEQVSDNVTAFRRPQRKSAPFGPSMNSGATQSPHPAVALLFARPLVVFVGIRYFWP